MTKRVLIEHTSNCFFRTDDQVLAALEFLKADKKDAHPQQIISDGKGFRFVRFISPEIEIDPEQFVRLKNENKLPELHSNRRFVLV